MTDIDALEPLRIPVPPTLLAAVVDRLPHGELGVPDSTRTRSGAWSSPSSAPTDDNSNALDIYRNVPACLNDRRART